ncbi:GNAT family N-acetyltransferase [Celerinatantimonas sp. YJH-8]|uniref:GNAT family N-acetyltransferase n=1 Tax=Celerinatantimonas sp. YJH-8 TaxID=3228714 RepID=UPI0038CBBFF9
MINWQLKTFQQLSLEQLYALLKLRVDVFVVEQNCPYSDLDDLDTNPQLQHLLGYHGEQLVAYARLLPAGLTHQTPSIGRVIVAKEARRGQVGYALLEEAIRATQTLWPNQPVTIAAQQHLEHFYQNKGFVTISDTFLEDGIPHVHMQLAP